MWLVKLKGLALPLCIVHLKRPKSQLWQKPSLLVNVILVNTYPKHVCLEVCSWTLWVLWPGGNQELLAWGRQQGKEHLMSGSCGQPDKTLLQFLYQNHNTQQQNVERLIRIWEPYQVDTMYEKRSTLDDTKCNIHKAPELINEDEELLSTSPSHEDHLL